MWIKFYICSPTRRVVFILLFTMMTYPCLGQKGQSVVIGSMVVRPSSILSFNPPDKNQGLLVPQLTTVERQAMRPRSPEEDGLFLFDTDDKAFYYWKNGGWIKGLGEGITNNTLAGIAAAGDLSGSYQAPSVSKLQGNAIATVSLTTADAGKV